jgi:hypothetical protein
MPFTFDNCRAIAMSGAFRRMVIGRVTGRKSRFRTQSFLFPNSYVAQVNLVIGHRSEAPQVFPFRLSEFPFSGLLERNSLSSRLLHKVSFPAASLSGQK